MQTIKKVLCPVDCEAPSMAALQRATALAQHFNAELILLNVIDPHSSGADPVSFGSSAETGEVNQGKVQAYTELMRLVSDELPTDAGVIAEVVSGDPAEEIIRRAKKDVDVIVMSTHGRTGWKRLVFGSVTDAVLRRSPCPVMTVTWNEAGKAPDITHQRIKELIARDHPGEANGAGRIMHEEYMDHRDTN